MNKLFQRLPTFILLMLVSRLAWAAPPPASELGNIRFSQSPEVLRIVFDLTTVPAYTAKIEENPQKIVVEMPAVLNKKIAPQINFNDPFVSALKVSEYEPGRLRAEIDLKMAVMYRAFVLPAPNRLVIDILKKYEQKIQEEVLPGIKYTSWLRSRPWGPVWARILEIDLKAGYALKPVLAKDGIIGLEALSQMAERNHAVAAVNGSYFAKTGQILGLMKIDGEIVSTTNIPRTAMGILPDGRILFDQVSYQGTVELPDKTVHRINGVNSERGSNELVLYNGYYGGLTGSNGFGTEYAITADGTVTAIYSGNAPLLPDGFILSAHGAAAQALAGLKVGDKVKITQTLGPVWDRVVNAIGAGPMLVKNGSVYLTTKIEEFGSDVAGGRAPRTAVGLTREGKILLVVVDGRQPASAGLTLLDLALFMLELGAVEAMNLDGGGSTEMVINDKIVNRPSEGKERKIGNALAVVAAKLAI